MDEVTRAENTMRAAVGGSQWFRTSNVSCNKGCLFGRIWSRWLAYAVTTPAVERKWLIKNNLFFISTSLLLSCCPTNLKDSLFREPLSTTSVLSRTASDGEDRRMREVAGTPSLPLGDPSLRRSNLCRTGSYSMSSCSVWLVRWIRSSTCAHDWVC